MSTSMRPVHFIVLTPFHAGGIVLQPGATYYSCQISAQRFVPLLLELGAVVMANETGPTLQALIKTIKQRGQQPLLLCFMPPHLLPQDVQCPMLVLFPWAYDTIPNETWGGEPRNDWRNILPSCAGVVTHSRYALAAIDAALELDIPASCIPTPIPARFFDLFAAPSSTATKSATTTKKNTWQLTFDGVVIDSHALGLDRSHRCDDPSFAVTTQHVAFNGIVYCLVVDPIDNSKNWLDSLWAFGFGFRDNADVTLIIKLSHHDKQRVCDLLLYEMRKMAPYRCRIVVLWGWLDDTQFAQLVQGTNFVINAARAEGQGLAVLEFMAAGKPAVCPRHTALLDYIDDDCAFVIDTSREWIHWPHDPRLMLRTRRYRIDWTSYRDALLQSYLCSTQQPARYQRMSQRAHAAAMAHASAPRISGQLQDFIAIVLQRLALPAMQRPALSARLRNALRKLLGRPST